MSYASTNNNIRMMNPTMDSDYYNGPPSQYQMLNQYQSYAPPSSHQPVNIQFPSYNAYESSPSGYYSPYAGAYEHQSRSTRQAYYGENHIEVVILYFIKISVYLCF
jgi:hypothetical protein